MSIEITTVSATLASFTVSANTHGLSAYWYYLNESSDGYTLVNPSTGPSAIYLDCPSETFAWGATANCSSNRIKVFANSRTVVYASTAVLGSNTIVPTLTSLTGWGVINDPPIIIVSQSSISPSSVQLSAGTLPHITFGASDQLTWTITPWQLTTDLTKTLSSVGFSTIGTSPNISGYRTGLGSWATLNPITVSLTSAYVDETIHGVTFMLSSEGFPFYQTSVFSFNSPIQIREDSTNSQDLTATAIKGNIPLPTNQNILWYSDPIKDIFTYPGGAPYIHHTVDTAGNIGTVILSANTQSELSATFTYYVSTEDGMGSSTFRPYVSGVAPNLEYRILDIYNEENITVYNVKLLGRTSTLYYNLDPSFLLGYSWTSPYVSIRMLDDVTEYNKNYAADTKDFDNVLIRINNLTVNTVPELTQQPYNITATTLSGNDLALDIMKSVVIPLSGWRYPSTQLFNPILKIDGTDSLIKYEEIPFALHTYTLSVGSETVLEPVSTDGTYTFYKDGVSISSGSFTNKADLLTKTTTNSVGPIAVPTTITYQLEVNANYNEVVPVTKTYTTTVKYIKIDHISSSDITAYPEYLWEPLVGWKLRVNPGGTLNTVTGGVLYGSGRSENVFLSATNIPGVILYRWYVYNGATLVYQGDTTTNTNWITVKSNCGTTNINVKLSVYNADSLGIPDGVNTATKTNALVFNPVPSTISSPTISVPTSMAAPGPISASVVSLGFTNLQYPLSVQLNTLTMNVSSSFWVTTVTNNTPSTNVSDITTQLTISDIGDSLLSVPKFESTPLSLRLTPIYKLKYYPAHPKYSDWCTIVPTVTGSSLTRSSTAYPVNPFYYNPNKYVVTGTDISFENVVPYTSLISSFTWASLSSTTVTDFNPYIVNYTLPGIYELSMKSYALKPLTLVNGDAVHVYSEYPVFDPLISRVVNDTIAPLPYKCGIGANEWLTSDNINHSFKKILDNLEHLIYQSKIYDNPPTQYIGWLGDIKMADYSTRFRWHVAIPGLNYKYDNPTFAETVTFNDIQDCVVRNNIMYISNNTSVHILSSDFSATEISSRSIKSIGVPFYNIKAIQLDPVDQNRIYLLDSQAMEVIVFLYNESTDTWTLLYNWGGFGSSTSHNKYNSPQDMLVDSEGLWVADTNNLVIKKYTRTGSWLKTISSSKFTSTNKPLSLCKDSNNNLQVLCTNKIEVFDSNGIFLYEYEVGSNFNKIRSAYDDGFVYISSPDSIVKSNLDGSIQLPLKNVALNASYVPNNRSIYHDEFRNLYACQSNHILKYNDQVNYVSLMKESVFDNMWDIDDIYIKKQEYVQDWVINKSLNRLWDNIEIARKSIIGKLSYEHIVNVDYQDIEIPVIDPVEENLCMFDWWPNFSVSAQNIVTNCYVIPRIRTFLNDEYIGAIHAKGDVLIGINELVSSDVINRVLCQLQDNLMGIYDMLEVSTDKSDELCSELQPTETDEFDTHIRSLSQCYPDFYTVYGDCQYATTIEGPATPCVGQQVTYNTNIIATTACKANITQLVWLVDGIEKLSVPYEDNESFTYRFGEDDVNVPRTITMVLLASNAFSTSTTVIPKLCMTSTITGPTTACTGTSVSFTINVNSNYVPVTGYTWTNNGTPVRSITTSSSADQYTFTPTTTSLKTIVATPLLSGFSITPAIIQKTSILAPYICI